jgi:murein DD-endopeptidase MepM/ murein hydrolase activator NlpD
MAGVRPLSNRWLATRHAVVRFCTGSHPVSIRAQLATGAVIFALSAWVTVTSVSYIGSRHLLSDTVLHIRNLEQAYTDLRSESQLSTKSFMAQIDELEATRQRQEDAVRELTETRAAVERQLDSRERQLSLLAEERDRARDQLGDLRQSLAGVEDRLETVLAAHNDLQKHLDSAEQRLAAASQQRDAERQVEVGLRWHLARLESEVKDLRSQRETAQVWLKDWVLGSTEALEQLFGETGVDVETLIARADSSEMGQGGPLQVAAPGPDGPADKLAQLPRSDPMQTNIQRLAALQKLARTLPLSSPLDHFYLTSPYGKRRDPFTNQWAFHAGLDFGAALGSKVLATAPGHVIHAGPAGPYGNMVEIDHGMGIVTRYGHLKSISVAVGDDVRFRQPIGVIGSTGRSTALHLHYEIRVDDAAYDPARFLNAGRFLVGIFANSSGSPVEEVADMPSGG